MEERMLNNGLKYKISILGDSISTYEGYNPYGYPVYYKYDRIYDNEMESVDDTWWKRVIDFFGGELCVNNSFSGSLVAGEFESSGCSYERCSALHEDIYPDLILIYMGTNDRGFESDIKMEEADNPKGFYGAYKIMLKKLKMNYPLAKIVCATLPMGRLKDKTVIENYRLVKNSLLYNNIIRRAVREENCFLADIASFGELYETLDYSHPTKNGHKTLSELWINALTAIL